MKLVLRTYVHLHSFFLCLSYVCIFIPKDDCLRLRKCVHECEGNRDRLFKFHYSLLLMMAHFTIVKVAAMEIMIVING